MTLRVDMYLLRDGADSAVTVACQLVGKAWPTHPSVQLVCNDQQQCQVLDELLWQIPENRLIGHGLSGYSPARSAPVQIGTEPVGDVQNNTVLVEMRSHHKVAQSCQQFVRVLDIVANSDSDRTAARQRYKAYRQLTTELHTHELS